LKLALSITQEAAQGFDAMMNNEVQDDGSQESGESDEEKPVNKKGGNGKDKKEKLGVGKATVVPALITDSQANRPNDT
jgi:hypothetical protein